MKRPTAEVIVSVEPCSPNGYRSWVSYKGLCQSCGVLIFGLRKVAQKWLCPECCEEKQK